MFTLIRVTTSNRKNRKGISSLSLIPYRQHERHKKRLEEIANRKVKAKINPEVEHN